MAKRSFFDNGLLSVLGILLSAYSIYVEYRVERKAEDPEDDFTALCDIEAIGASCSTVFALPEAKMLSFFGLVPHGSILDIPNGYLGIAFYLLSLIRHFVGTPKSCLLSHIFRPTVNLIITTLAFSSSIFLARKLYIIKEICVVCITTHIINTTIFYRSIQEVLSVPGRKIKPQ